MLRIRDRIVRFDKLCIRSLPTHAWGESSMLNNVIRVLAVTTALAWPALACHAQKATGPKTLEGLLGATEAVRPEGTLLRPGGSSDLPAIDKAWKEYDTAVKAGTSRLLSAIDIKVRAARKKGDDDAVASFEAVKEAFSARGALPSICVPALGTERTTARQAYKAAAAALAKAYESALQMPEAPPELKDEWRLLENMLGLVDEPQLDSVWEHVLAGREAVTITFYSNGAIDSPDAPHTWVLKDGVLTIRWQNPEAPGGAWIDTCELSAHGGSYAGRNQVGTGISGKRKS